MNEDPTSAPKKQKVDETLEGMNVMPEKTRLCNYVLENVLNLGPSHSTVTVEGDSAAGGNSGDVSSDAGAGGSNGGGAGGSGEAGVSGEASAGGSGEAGAGGDSSLTSESDEEFQVESGGSEQEYSDCKLSCTI